MVRHLRASPGFRDSPPVRGAHVQRRPLGGERVVRRDGRQQSSYKGTSSPSSRHQTSHAAARHPEVRRLACVSGDGKSQRMLFGCVSRHTQGGDLSLFSRVCISVSEAGNRNAMAPEHLAERVSSHHADSAFSVSRGHVTALQTHVRSPERAPSGKGTILSRGRMFFVFLFRPSLMRGRNVGTAPRTGEKAQASFRGRPRGRVGTAGSGKGRMRGRPRRFGAIQGAGATWSPQNSATLQTGSVTPLTMAGGQALPQWWAFLTS